MSPFSTLFIFYSGTFPLSYQILWLFMLTDHSHSSYFDLSITGVTNNINYDGPQSRLIIINVISFTRAVPAAMTPCSCYIGVTVIASV